MNPIRIGRITFTNILPLYLFFNFNNLNIKYVSEVPAELNSRMARGEIDIGPISSYAYGESQDKYFLLPNLSISAEGPVRSIFLFSKKKTLKALDGVNVAITNTSASSVVLLRILFEKFLGVHPYYIPMNPCFQKMMKDNEACLLIGDEAILADWTNKEYTRFDLGEEWYKWTGLSMTFAVWAVRKELIDTRSKELEAISNRFEEAKEKGRLHKNLVIEKAMQKLGGTPHFWSTYFEGLCYHLEDKELMGLQAFYDYAYDLRFLKKRVHINTLRFSI